jgi:tryptophan synthase beta chain
METLRSGSSQRHELHPSDDGREATGTVPKHWLSPRLISGVSGLGPFEEGTERASFPSIRGETLFPRAVWTLEVSEGATAIPAPLREIMATWRPTPLREARRLQSVLGLKSRVFFKDESVSPVGSYKANAALAQAWFASRDGVASLAGYTLAGFWGAALGWAAERFKLPCQVMIPRELLERRPELIEAAARWGAEVKGVNVRPDRVTLCRNGVRLAAGCFFNSVVAFNSVIGQEACAQLRALEIRPDVLVGCCGGGTNFSGLLLPFLIDKEPAAVLPRLIAVEPAASRKFDAANRARSVAVLGPSGPYYSTLTPTQKPRTGSLAGGLPWAPGLSYPVATPLLVALHASGRLEGRSCDESSAMSAGQLFEEAEGILVAPESAYAVWGAIEAARELDRVADEGSVLFCLTARAAKRCPSES